MKRKSPLNLGGNPDQKSGTGLWIQTGFSLVEVCSHRLLLLLLLLHRFKMC